jgi:hypothetical protein
MKKIFLFLTNALCLILIGCPNGFGQNQESFVQPSDIADAIESNFSSLGNHLIRWSVKYQSTKIEKVSFLQQASALKKLVSKYETEMSEEGKGKIVEELAVLKELAANHPKSTAYRCQLLVSGKNIQCYLGPVGDPESNDKIEAQVFPNQLVDSSFLKKHWNGGLVYSLYDHPNKSMILRQMNAPTELRREVSKGKIFKMVYEFCGPFYLPHWNDDQFDMRWGLEQVSVNLKSGSFVESLRIDGWDAKELDDGKIQIEKSITQDFFARTGSRTPKKSENESLETKYLTRFIFSKDLLPTSKVIFKSIVANGNVIDVRVSEAIQQRLKGSKQTSPDDFFPVQIVDIDYRESDGTKIVNKMVATSYGMLFRDSTDSNVFPCEPRFAKSIYGAFDTMYLDHLPSTQFHIEEANSLTLETEKFESVVTDFKPMDFEFSFGDTPVIERSSNEQQDRSTPYRTEQGEPVDAKKQENTTINFGPAFFLLLMVVGVVVVLFTKKTKS